MQWIDLAGLIDVTYADFIYPNWDFSNDFYTNVFPLSSEMFTFLTSFKHPSLFEIDSTHNNVNYNLKLSIMNFIDKINY